ncbi:MAG: hypothetical protein IJD37_01655 [Clostridia bacterium]|nr:hypothetical protein [Clostridia bacterium]
MMYLLYHNTYAKVNEKNDKIISMGNRQSGLCPETHKGAFLKKRPAFFRRKLGKELASPVCTNIITIS